MISGVQKFKHSKSAFLKPGDVSAEQKETALGRKPSLIDQVSKDDHA